MIDALGYWTADEVAECLDVGNELYAKLYSLANEASNHKPLGGDGSDGTTEEPIVANDCGNSMKQLWDKLTPEEQEQIEEAFNDYF